MTLEYLSTPRPPSRRPRAALIVARRRMDDDRAPLLWSMTRLGGSFDVGLTDQAEAELARLRTEYDIA